MRSGLFGLASTSAFVVTGLLALATIPPAHAQGKPQAKPGAAQPAKPAAKADPKAGAKADPKAGAKADPKAGAKADPKATAKADPKKADKTACATEPKPKLSDAKKKDEAKKAFNEGKTRLEKSDYEGALTCFKLADAYVPGPAPKYRAALALDKLGRVQEAVAAYEAFLSAAGPTPDDKYKEIAAEGKKRMDELKLTPTKVKLAITPADAPNAKVTLDGAPQAGMELSVPPGKHTLEIKADGFEPFKQEIEVGFAETKDIGATLTPKAPEPAASASAPAPSASAAPTATAVASATATAPVTPPPQKSYVPAYVTLGLAGAGAIVGGIFGGLALSSKSDFDKNPTLEKADETDRNALIADMSFAVALTFGVTGVVLLLSDAGQPSQPAKAGVLTHQKPAKKASLPRGFVAPYATPTGGGAAARFEF